MLPVEENVQHFLPFSVVYHFYYQDPIPTIMKRRAIVIRGSYGLKKQGTELSLNSLTLCSTFSTENGILYGDNIHWPSTKDIECR